jgi:carboxymethylenebutenolidase
MLHEAWGLDDVLRRQAQRLASVGYIVIAPDLMGDGNRLKCMISVFKAMRAARGRPFELIEACQRQLRADADCTGRIGVIGFCMGGGFALLLGNRGFDASSVNYGMVPSDLDAVLAGSCPMVGSYGAKDKALAKEVPRLEEGLTRHGIVHEFLERRGQFSSAVSPPDKSQRRWARSPCGNRCLATDRGILR